MDLIIDSKQFDSYSDRTLLIYSSYIHMMQLISLRHRNPESICCLDPLVFSGVRVARSLVLCVDRSVL